MYSAPQAVEQFVRAEKEAQEMNGVEELLRRMECALDDDPRVIQVKLAPEHILAIHNGQTLNFHGGSFTIKVSRK